MQTILTSLLEPLRRITDAELVRELRNYSMAISGDKYHAAFSSFSVSRLLDNLPLEVIAPGANRIPASNLEGIRRTAATVLRVYTTLVLMRSEYLEKGLDDVSETSVFAVYKRVFRAGKIKHGEDTLAQHVRNSLCHGSFSFSDDLRIIRFEDKNWKSEFDIDEFNEFC